MNIEKIIPILTLIFMTSCFDYEVTDTKVVRGVVTAKEEGWIGRASRFPKFYVSSPKEIVTIDVPFDDENLFKIGDTICVVVKTVKDKR